MCISNDSLGSRSEVVLYEMNAKQINSREYIFYNLGTCTLNNEKKIKIITRKSFERFNVARLILLAKVRNHNL